MEMFAQSKQLKNPVTGIVATSDGKRAEKLGTGRLGQCPLEKKWHGQKWALPLSEKSGTGILCWARAINGHFSSKFQCRK